MKPTDTIWQTPALAATFLEGVRGAIPLAKEQIEIMLRIITAAIPNPQNFLDLGCGDGVLGRAILANFPSTQGVFLDFSPTMLDAAKKKIGDNPNITYILAGFGESTWLNSIDSNFDIVISGFSIHHQPDERKKQLYQEIYARLKPKGVFLNLEHVASKSRWGEQLFEEYFIDALYQYHQQQNPDITRSEIAQTYYHRPDKTANILASVEDQCRWLSEIGYEEVDCFFKTFELALFGGIKL